MINLVRGAPPLRSLQERVLKQVLDAHSRGVRTIILQAPTGTGKSLIGRTLCNHFESAYLLTPTKSLQNQYWADFSESGRISLLKGKANYDCEVYDRAYTAEDAPCQSQKSGRQIKICRDAGTCPYYLARDVAAASDISIMNFVLYLTWRMIGAEQEIPLFDQREIHIVDEAHRIEDCVTNHLELKLYEWQLKKMLGADLFRTLGPMPLDAKNQDQAAMEYLGKVGKANQARLMEYLREYGASSVGELAAMAMEAEDIKKEVLPSLQLREKLNNLFQGEESVDNYALGFGTEAYRKGRPNGTFVSAKPLDIKTYVKDRVLGQTTVFMSATLPLTEVWARDLGLTDYEIIDVPSDFPATNRPIFFTPVGSFKKGGAEKMAGSIGTKIEKILEHFPQEKGIIHTPSYAFNRLLAEHLKGNRFLVCQSGDDSEPMLEKHKETKEPTLLVSPAMREGVDLKDELSRVQIIVKAPFDSLGDAAIRKKMEKNPQWYSMRSLTSLLQMYGRSIRSQTDYARTYILDTDLLDFMKKMRKHIPPYVLEAVHWPPSM